MTERPSAPSPDELSYADVEAWLDEQEGELGEAVNDRRLGLIDATLVSDDGSRARVRLGLDPRFERSLPDVLHAIACAAPGDKPGRTVVRQVRWPAPVIESEQGAEAER